MIDMTGKQIGNLIITGRDESKPKGSGKPVFWLCDCVVCGSKNNSIDGRHLRGKNPQQSCGCNRGDAVNWLNKTQGRLTIIEDLHKTTKDRHKIWKYKCECGNIGEISSASLRVGTQSCGCLIKENINISNKNNLLGQKFEHLLVIEETNQRTNKGNIIWKCKCDCGNECFASTSILVNGDKKSCGCITQSKGAEQIEKLLQENNIPFEKEKRFNDCRDTYPLPFDFYVDNKYIIEYDGEQHSKAIQSWGGIEELLKIKQHDSIKNEWCFKNHIPIIRLNYKIKDIKLEDLIPETSNWTEVPWL